MPTNPFPAAREQTANTLPSASPHAILSGLQQKRRIINELIGGHLPLLEAAVQFQAVRATTVCLERVTGVPTATDNESLCRTVIGWVHLVLSDRPEQAERISQQLESELQGYLETSGQANLSPCC